MLEKSSISNGIYYHYIKNSKNGHTLVFLHGFTGSSLVWKEMIEQLRKKYSILTLDLIGHGKSCSPHKIEEYSFESQSNKVISILNKLKINSLSVISYSYSCYIGMLISKKLYKKVKHLIFISPYFKENYIFLERAIIKVMEFLWKYLVKDKKHDLDYSKIENPESPSFKDTKYALKSINTKDVIGSICSFAEFGKSRKIEVLDMPLLIVYGQKDKRFSKEIKKSFKRKNVTFKVILGKKHLFLKTKSKDIAKDIDSFLIKNF